MISAKDFVDRLFKVLIVCFLIILTIIIGLHANQDDKIISQEQEITSLRKELSDLKDHVIGNSLKQLREEIKDGE